MEILYKETGDVCRKKLSNGQIVELKFGWYTLKNKYQCHIILYINKRKQGYINKKQTGKCGLEGLLAAKQLLKEYIEAVKTFELCYNMDIEMIAYPADRKRAIVYDRGLKDLGFKWEQCDGMYRAYRLVIPKLNNVNK